MNENIDNRELTEDGSDYGRGILIGLIVGVLVATVIFAGIQLFHNFTHKTPIDANGSDNVIDDDTIKKITNIQKIIDGNLYSYDEDITSANVEEGIYKGMIASLGDKYSDYYSAEEMNVVLDDYEGVSYGIGCYVSLDDNGIAQIYGVFEDSPAEKAGVQNGDLIIAVEGESVIGLSLSAVVDRIKGPENTEVNITFRRDGEDMDMTVMRGKLIETTSVNSGLLIDDEEIGYIQIKEFAETTTGQFKEALDDLRGEGIRGLIIDLRGNPGGAFGAVVDIARYILPEGLVVYTEDAKGVRKELTCDGENELDIPLVVLVNSYSASASEVLAGAIQDHNKGTILGTTTFGKGIVQSLLEVGDGSVVKLTTSAYFTPSGRNIQGTGIEPDIELEYDYDLAEKEGIDNQVTRAIEILRDKIGD